MGCCSGDSLWGISTKYIKVYGGDIVAVDGVNIEAKLGLSDLRMPYKQISKSKVVLKPGVVNFLLNAVNIGDNCTFIGIAARYHTKSVNEEDNYLSYYFYDDPSKQFAMGKMMVLTGNSTHRIKQMYISNPNPNYEVELEVMIGVIDDSYSYFPDVDVTTGSVIRNLTLYNIGTHVVNEYIVILDNSTPMLPRAYISIIGINIERYGTVVTIDVPSTGKIYLDFRTEWDAKQAHSLINFATNTQGGSGDGFEWSGVIDDLTPREDALPPVVYFRNNVSDGIHMGEYILLYDNNLPSPIQAPYNTTQGTDFRTEIALATFATGGLINKTMLINMLVNTVRDNRDGVLTLNEANILLKNDDGYQINVIGNAGDYEMSFVYGDIAGNMISTDIIIKLHVTLT